MQNGDMNGKKDYPILERTYQWSLSVIELCYKLPDVKLGKVLFHQLVRSSTSVAANLVEGSSGLSKKDFLKCFGISLKECNESKLWLRYIVDTKLLEANLVENILQEATELAKIISAIIIKTKTHLKK